jgi:DNA-binding LacI/PurR family transcriptional regulator
LLFKSFTICDKGFCQPSITTIRQPTRELGAQVAHSLLAILDGQEVEDKILDVKLVKRQSSATK